MSITAEKIEQIARIIGGPTYGFSAVRERSLETARQIAALLQRGEPEGWKRVPEIVKQDIVVMLSRQLRSAERTIEYPRFREAFNHVGAMLSASPLPPATEQGWRPIETAPKDGTKIITFAPDGGIEVSFYYADTLENGTAYETWRDDGCEPTHWMPLPPAPGAETSVTTGATLEAEEREMRRLAERLGYEIENPAASSSRQAVLEEKDNS